MSETKPMVAVGDRLDELAVAINTKMEEGHGFARRAVQAYIEVGEHLLEARNLHPGDKEFGQWRMAAVPNVQSNWAGKLMQIAKDERLRVPELADFSVSALGEMVSISDVVYRQILDKAKETGTPPTVKEIRKVKGNEAEGPAREVAGEVLPPEGQTPGHEDDNAKKNESVTEMARPNAQNPFQQGQGKAHPPVDSIEKRAQAACDLPLKRRLEMYVNGLDTEVDGDPFVVFGIGSQFTETAPNEDTLAILYEAYSGQVAVLEAGEIDYQAALENAFQDLSDTATGMRE